VSCFGNRNTAFNINANKPLHTEKAVTANGNGLRLVSNNKLSLHKCSSALVPLGLKKKKIRN